MTDKLYCYLHLGACRLDYGNPNNHQILSQTVLFNNVNQKAEQLSPAAFNDYLAEHGFVTYKSHLAKRLRYYQEKSVTPISLTVSLDLKGESVEFEKRVNPDAKRYNDINPTAPKPHEVTHGIDNMDISGHGLARFLDSGYSIDTLITWLESKQFDIPLGIYAFADEIQKWQQVPELQTEAVGNDGADSQAPTNQTTTETHNAKEDGQNDVTPKAKALERLKNLEQYIETLENQAKAKDIEFDKMDLLLTKQQVLNELKKRYPNFKIKIDAFEPVWKLATKKQICANQRANTKNGEEFLKSILG